MNPGGHTGEHLELDAVVDAARGAQLVGERDVKDVLPSDSQSDGTGALGGHRPLKHALVVRVACLFGRPRGQLPSVDLRIHLFHGQVGALHDSHLDGCPSRIDALARPFLELLEGAQGVGQVGLQDDAGLVACHVGLVEDCGEHSERQVQILVVFHVEVHEGPRVSGETVEGKQRAHPVGDDLFKTPGVVWAGNGRDLDRDVVDVIARDEAGDLKETTGGFLLSEDCLSEKVNVEPIPSLAQTG